MAIDAKRNDSPAVFSWCCTELSNTNYSRRCFMSGEYCSKQDLIQRERRRLHEHNSINAFVVMSFSGVSDVIYKWKLKSFIEDLKERLYFNDDKSRLYCFPDIGALTDAARRDIAEKYEKEKGLKADDVVRYFTNEKQTDVPGDETVGTKVEKINVIRADSSPSTNYVVCNRICQQLQIADLVIVDVSSENANVFYELGMAVALGKMILPLCASETYYRMALPKQIQELDEDTRRKYEHHIGCFPWRKDLFEHFGIRYRNHENSYTNWIEKLRDSEELIAETGYGDENIDTSLRNPAWITQYLPFDEISREKSGFGDRQYAMSPYLVKKKGLAGFEYVPTIKGETGNVSIGECIYKKLQTSYNLATGRENTLVLYSMDGFLNEAQAALCIVNYFNAVVRQFREQHCFCGERVGVLLQPIEIPEDPKDGKQQHHYNIGEVIQIGMNQATYKAHMEMVKPDNFLNCDTRRIENQGGRYETEQQFIQWKNSIERQTKGFIRNRCISIYPKSPVYVKRVENDLQADIFEDIILDSSNYPEPKRNDSRNQTENDEAKKQVGRAARLFYCYYHVMLRTLRYTNEIVVDIGENSLQSFFWLGAAHASDTSAIAVRHIKSEREKKDSPESAKQLRSIFDVSGLWTAVYRTEDAEGFFKQLFQAQAGIEQYSKLILKDRDSVAEEESELFWTPKIDCKDIKPIIDKKELEENATLEAYYRNRFWRSLMKCNRLHFYISEQSAFSIENGKPFAKKGYVEKWDVEAVSLLSNYLSRKNAISDYRVLSLGKHCSDEEALKVNSICIGNESNEIIKYGKGEKDVISFPDYFKKKLSKDNYLYLRDQTASRKPCKDCPTGLDNHAMFKRYFVDSIHSKQIISQLPDEHCYYCLSRRELNVASPVNEICDKRSRLVFLNDFPDDKPVSCSLKNINRFRFAEDADATGAFHIELAQLVLWRDPAESEDDDHFRVNISGATGAATYALSSQLVNKELKRNVVPEPILDNHDTGKSEWEKKLWIRQHPLSALQNSVQDEVLKEYEKLLRKKLKKGTREITKIINENASDVNYSETDIEKWTLAYKMYTNRVVTTVRLYLSTVLYRYFFPFITKEDIERICNGMKMYVSSLRADNSSPFSLKYPKNIYDNFGVVMGEKTVLEAADVVVAILQKTLTNLRCVEAFYEVEVRDERDEKTDSVGKAGGDDEENVVYYNNKKIVGITLSSLNKIGVRCLS